jgi:hypothetical protein
MKSALDSLIEELEAGAWRRTELSQPKARAAECEHAVSAGTLWASYFSSKALTGRRVSRARLPTLRGMPRHGRWKKNTSPEDRRRLSKVAGTLEAKRDSPVIDNRISKGVFEPA